LSGFIRVRSSLARKCQTRVIVANTQAAVLVTMVNRFIAEAPVEKVVVIKLN